MRQCPSFKQGLAGEKLSEPPNPALLNVTKLDEFRIMLSEQLER